MTNLEAIKCRDKNQKIKYFGVVVYARHICIKQECIRTKNGDRNCTRCLSKWLDKEASDNA